VVALDVVLVLVLVAIVLKKHKDIIISIKNRI
jgi:hypothetical protein